MNYSDMIVAIFCSVLASWGITQLTIRFVLNDLADQINDANNKMQQAINTVQDVLNREIVDKTDDIYRSINGVQQQLSREINRESLIADLEATSDKKDIRRLVENRI